MKEEILSIAEQALTAIDEFENYLFANHRAKYAMSKSILDQHREQIHTIKKGLELELDDAGFSDARSDLCLIIDNVNNARYGNAVLEEPQIDTTEVDQMLDSLNQDRVETEYPTQDVNLNGINDAINTLENIPVEGIVEEPQTQLESIEETLIPEQTFEETLIPIQTIEETQVPMQSEVINVPELNVAPTPQVDANNDIDINGLDAFMNTQVQQ